MFQSLLVPLDGSEFSERTLPIAGGLARATGAALHVAHVHVTHTPDHFLSNTQFHFEGLDLAEYDTRHRDEERTYLDNVRVRLSEGGTDAVDLALLEGRVAEGISEYARSIGADVILMTTHGYSGMNRIWLGSVTDALIRETVLPILVLHPGAQGHLPPDVSELHNILVPLDTSGLAEAILAPASDLAIATGAKLTLLHVVSASGIFGIRFLPLLPDTLTPEMDRAQDYLERVAERLRRRGLQVDVEVVSDTPARGIVETAKRVESDCIALATHGYGGLKRALLGSVADQVLQRTSLPLLIQRPA